MTYHAYLAGPMRGYPLYNFPTFMLAADLLRASGLTVINPAELDLAAGVNPHNHSVEFCIRDAMKRDTAAVCDVGMVFLLPGWERSQGVLVEVTLGMMLGHQFYEITGIRLDLIRFRHITHKEINERTRSMREPRIVPEVREQGQPGSLFGWLREVFQRGVRTLRDRCRKFTENHIVCEEPNGSTVD